MPGIIKGPGQDAIFSTPFGDCTADRLLGGSRGCRLAKPLLCLLGSMWSGTISVNSVKAARQIAHFPSCSTILLKVVCCESRHVGHRQFRADGQYDPFLATACK